MQDDDFNRSPREFKRKATEAIKTILNDISNDGDFDTDSDEDFKLIYSSDSSFSSTCSSSRPESTIESNEVVSIQRSIISQSSISTDSSNTSDSLKTSDCDSIKSTDMNQESTSRISTSSSTSSGVHSTYTLSEDCSRSIASDHINLYRSNPVIKNTELEYEIVAGKRRNSKLLYSLTESIFYKRNSKIGSNISYCCYVQGCSARALLKADGTCIKKSGTHLHPTHEVV